MVNSDKNNKSNNFSLKKEVREKYKALYRNHHQLQSCYDANSFPSEPGPPSEWISCAIIMWYIIFLNEGHRDVRLALQGITKEWDDLAKALGLPDSDIDAIKRDAISSSNAIGKSHASFNLQVQSQ